MRLSRPCRGCGVYFNPSSRLSRHCFDCVKESQDKVTANLRRMAYLKKKVSTEEKQ